MGTAQCITLGCICFKIGILLSVNGIEREKRGLYHIIERFASDLVLVITVTRAAQVCCSFPDDDIKRILMPQVREIWRSCATLT
jgi:hypothetical protein